MSDHDDDHDHRHHHHHPHPFPPPLFDRDPSKVIVVETTTHANCVHYLPADPTKWAGTPPATVQEAIDRIAAVLGATVPIP